LLLLRVADGERAGGHTVNAWGRATFGDPCRECGYAWDVEPDDAARIVADAPAAFRQALAGEDGTRTHPERGPQTVTDVVRTNAHDVHHHLHDVRRILGRPVTPPVATAP
jgi:hypothetical protein